MNGIAGKEKLSRVLAFYFSIPAVILLALYFYVTVHPYIDVAINILAAIWCLICIIAFWRCAFNTQFKFLGYIARLSVAPIFLLFLATSIGAVTTVHALMIYGAP